MQLFYLPPYTPELNLIEIVWKQAKYHWRNFVTWTKETIDDEVRSLLGAYGTKFQSISSEHLSGRRRDPVHEGRARSCSHCRAIGNIYVQPQNVRLPELGIEHASAERD